MSSKVMTNRTLLLGILAAAALSSRCSGGCAGCDALDPIPGGFPQAQIIENSTQVRVTQSGLVFLGDNAGPVVQDLMGGPLEFDVPPTCDIFLGVDICGNGGTDDCVTDNAANPCAVAATVQGVNIVPDETAGDAFDVEVQLNIVTPPGQELRTHGAATECRIAVDTSAGSLDHVRVTTRVVMHTDSVSGRTSFVIGRDNDGDWETLWIPDGDIEDDDIVISAVNLWDVSCYALEIDALETLIINQFIGPLNDMAGPLIGDNLCMGCDAGQVCPALSTCDASFCQEDSGDACVMPLGVEGRLDLGALMASIAPGMQADLDLHLWAGGYAEAENAGLSLGFLGGARTPEHNECVPLRDPPDTTSPPQSAVFESNTRPADNQPFHLGIGIHKKLLDAVGFAAYDSGALCLDIGAREVDMLTTTTFQLIAGSMLELTHDEEGPIVISVRPQNPLTFELSEQVVTQDAGTGEYEIDTPLLTLRSSDFAIDFYLLMDFRYVRIFRVMADLAIPVALVMNSDNQLIPVLGDLSEAFENLRVVDSQLLSEDPAAMATVFPTILGMAAGLIGDIAAIDLPDLQGFQLVMDDGSMTAVDGNTLMAIFANLAYVTPAPKDGHSTVQTEAQIAERHLPPEGMRIRTPALYKSHGPAVTLALGGTAPANAAGDLEWQYRVNGGFWSLFTDAPVVLLRRPEFLLQGNHAIEVRGRVKGQPATLDRHPATLHFRVDTVAPTLDLTREGYGLSWAGRDNLTDVERLEYQVRLNQSDWSPWHTDLSSFTLPHGFQGEYAVRVRDEAGNEATVTEHILGLYGRVTVPPSNSSCSGCRQTNTNAGVVWGLFGLLLFVWIRRRRGTGRSPGWARGRSLPFLMAVGVAAGSGARCDCGNNPGHNCPDAGPQDLICLNPDEPCPQGELVPATPIILDATNNCEPRPVMCECEGGVFPLNPGDFGRFLSADARDGLVVVSSYSDRFGDLVVSTLDEQGGVVPEAVDGIGTDNTPDWDPEGYRGGSDKRGDKVGTWTSAAIASDGTVGVSYVDEEEGGLKFAQGTPGDWAVHVVQAHDFEDTWTYYTALQLGPGDVPEIAFMVSNIPDPNTPGGFVGQLRYATASTATPTSEADWTIVVVDEVPVPCGGLCESSEVCVAATWTCQPEDSSCPEACPDGEECVAGVCEAEIPRPGWLDHPEGLGLYVHAKRLSTGAPVLAYHDRTLGLLRLAVGSATGDGTDFTALTLEGDEFTDIGLYVSLTVDASDLLHLTYTDAVRDELIYAQADAAGTVLLREVVDDGARPLGGPTVSNEVVGLDSIVFFDGAGALHVLYQNGTHADLWHGQRNGADDWTIAPLREGDAGYGYFVDVARDTDGTVWVAEYIYDRATDALNRLEVWAL